jgi:beta-lactamase superfamily II metal-dependent hydrolase
MVLNEFAEKAKVNFAEPPVLIESGGVKIAKIWPVDESMHVSTNDASCVYKLEYSGKTVLMCSDIERFAQQQIMQKYPQLKADIVIMPHHGSKTTLDQNFIKFLNPMATVYSCAYSQYMRMQDDDENKAEKFYTCIDGAVSIRIASDGREKISGYIRNSK